MFITKVELENIKSYRHATIELRRGATAIRGPNGAGKTTLVEAIGFALFNSLPYSQAQFVREGERSGQVTVSFIGADDRLYQVVRRCGTPSAWYVYDEQLDKRLVDQNADVIDWLREHLPLQGEIKLEAFFSDALGVQQGTFTSDFLLTGANRKRKFDALLQVEDYRRAYEKLNDTKNYLQNCVTALNGRIEGLERETQGIDHWREELTRLQAEEANSKDQLLAAHTQSAEAARLREHLSKLSSQLQQLDNQREREETRWQQAKDALEQARTALEETETARRKVINSSEDYKSYLEVGEALTNARQQQQVHQGVLQRRSDCATNLAAAQARVENAESHLKQIKDARQRMAELAPQVELQAALEQNVAEAKDRVKRLRQGEEELAQLATKIERLTADLNDLAAEMATIEAQRPLAALHAERRAAVDALQLEVRLHGERERELATVREQLETLAQRRQKDKGALEKARADVAKLLDKQEIAATLPRLETEFAELDQQIVMLRTNIKRHNESKLQSAGGQCPFLKEPCLNIKQKGQASLEAYFDGLIARDQKQLAPLEAERVEMEQEVKQVRLYKQFVDRLPEFEQRLREAQERWEEGPQEQAKLLTRERELAAWLKTAGDHPRKLADARRLLEESERADRQVSRIDDLLRQQSALQGQMKSMQDRQKHLQTEQTSLLDAPAQEAAAIQQLQALGNPRQEYIQQESIANQEQDGARRLDEAQRQASEATKQIAALDAELAPYAGLEARIDALTRQQEQSQAGYQTYLENQQIAGKLPERQAAYTAAQAAEREAQQRCTAAQQRYVQVAGEYDPQALAEAEAEDKRLFGVIAELGQKLYTLNEEIETKARQISEAEGKQAELEALGAERQETLESREMLQQFRETIKDAGPYVMKELLRQISREANRIFGEILGDRSVELSWEEEYEIVWRSRGQTRTFAQLSGGEQMSAALAVRLALLKTLAQLDIAFFDEPTQSMDDLRRVNLAEQIKRVRGFNQLIVISHDDTFEQGLDSVIYLSKRDGETIVGAVDEGVEDFGAEDLALVGSSEDRL
ncbi:MAG TPA: SMC family ATPase [Ktedonobacterales bacterium]